MYLYLRILSLMFATLLISSCDETMLLHELEEDETTEETVSQVSVSPSSRSTVETLIKNDLVILDSDGNVQNLVGFETSIEFESTQSIVESENFQQMYQNDEKLFTFEAPKGVEAELSEPILKTNSGLSLTGSSYTCEEQFYQSSEPTIGDLIDVSNESKVCGDVNMVVCIRMAEDDANITGTSDYAYTETPNMSFHLPCKENSFAGLSMSLEGGKESISEELIEVTMSHSKSVVEVFLTENRDCSTGGDWTTLDSSILWNFAWSSTKTEGTLYAKFRDFYGETSNCFTDSITYSTGDSVTTNHSVTESTSNTEDTTLPTVTIANPSHISSSNVSSYSLSGTCSENTRVVTLSIGNLSQEVTCTSNQWAISSWNLASLSDSTSLNFSADHSDAAGNNAVQATAAVIKDTVIPSVSINALTTITNANANSYSLSGTCSEDTQAVTVQVESLSQTPTCTSNTWSVTGWDVSSISDQSSLSFTANHSDIAGNSANQDSETVLKDATAPTAPTPVANAEWITSVTSSPNFSWQSSGSNLTYEVSLGTTAGGSDVVDWQNVGSSLSHTFSTLSLSECTNYYSTPKLLNSRFKYLAIEAHAL